MVKGTFVIRTMSEAQAETLQVSASISGCLSLIAVFPPAYNLWQDRSGKSSIAQQYFSVLLTMNGFTALMYAIGRSAEVNHGLCQFQAYMIQAGGLAIQIFESYVAIKMYYLIVKKMSPDRLARNLNRDVIIIYVLCFSYALIFLLMDAFGPDSDWCWIEGGKDDKLRFFALYISLMTAFTVCITSIITIQRSIKGSDDKSLSDSESRVKHKLFAYVWVFVFCWSWGLINRIVEAWTLKSFFPTALIQAMLQPLQGLLNTLVYHNSFAHCYNYFWPREGAVGSDIQKIKFQKNVMMSEQMNLQIDRRSISGFSRRGSRLTELQNVAGYRRENESIMTMGKLANGICDHHMFATSMNSWEKYEHGEGGSSFSARKEDTNNGVTRYNPKIYSVFTSTFNLGEASAHSLRSNIADWLMPDHDIYVIGMQEALELVMIRELMVKQLGGMNEYVMFTEEIGSDNTAVGYHGYIALTVFVRKSEVDKGYIREINTSKKSLATGRNMGLAKAANKGGVGIPFQIHDTSVCFVTSHLPSDASSKRKVEQRNICAHDILSELSLSSADLGFSMHKQTDHVIFTGDLNYRIFPLAHEGHKEGMAGGGEVCQDVATAAAVEKDFIGMMDLSHVPGNWREKRAQLLRSIKKDPLSLKFSDASALMEARANAALEWTEAVKHDELTKAMAEGFAFSEFEEAHIAFAPTYKRKIGRIEGCQHCGDYSDAAVVFNGFSNTEGMESDDLSPQLPNSSPTPAKVKDAVNDAKLAKKMRPPSYTDRILVHSLSNRSRRLAFQAYDTCEAMVVSDHRPVSMVMTLEVNSAVIFPLNFVQKLDEKKFGQNNKAGADSIIVGKGKYYLYELIINNLKVDLLEHQQDKPPVIIGDEDADSGKTVNAILEGDENGDEEMGWGAIQNPLQNESTRPKSAEMTSSAAARPQSTRMVDIDLNRNSEFSQGGSNKSSENVESEQAPSPLRKSKKRKTIVGAIWGAGKDLFKSSSEKESKGGKIKKRRASRPSSITNIKVGFPLPGKDPLLPFRQIASLAKAFEVNDKSILDTFQDVAIRSLESKYPNDELHQVKTDSESLLTDLSVFPCTCTHKVGKLTETGVADIIPQNGVTDIIPQNSQTFGNEEEIHSDFISCPPMRMCGCIVPELGTHVIIALVDSQGENHGEFTISLSHLVDLKSNSRKDEEVADIPVSRGGELRGKASGMFSLSLLTILSTESDPQLAKLLA